MIARLLRWLVVGVTAASALACGNSTSTATSPTTTSPVTETFLGQFGPGGSASRSFTAASSGTVTVTVTQLSAANVGLGIGIPQSNNVGCYLSQTIAATTGSSLTATVEAGTYCTRIYDLGTLTAPVAFTLSIVRP